MARMKNGKFDPEDIPEVYDIREQLDDDEVDIQDFNQELAEILDDETDYRPAGITGTSIPRE